MPSPVKPHERYRQELEAIDRFMTQGLIAKFIGRSKRMIRYYKSGRYKIPHAIGARIHALFKRPFRFKIRQKRISRTMIVRGALVTEAVEDYQHAVQLEVRRSINGLMGYRIIGSFRVRTKEGLEFRDVISTPIKPDKWQAYSGFMRRFDLAFLKNVSPIERLQSISVWVWGYATND